MRGNMIERVKTGIPGLDEITNGGFVKGTNVLVTGAAGTGKTIFCMQFLYYGASEYDEPGVFVTLEERPNDLRREARQFGWDIEKMEREGKLIIIDAASSRAGLPTSEPYTLRRGFDISTLAQEIYKATKEINAERVVIDSLSSLGIRFESLTAIRTAIFKIASLLNDLNTTSLLTSEITSKHEFSRFGVEEFIAQGIIILYLNEERGELKRSLVVRKLRFSKHSLKVMPFEIGDNGIIILPSGGI
ncbi:MAG: ATPase domain-containing protein [Candidatus Freyarchaeota archaeon]|nr:gas vesicle protein GvpD [Candidatus Freyrarchaeum guaymaensis]